MSGKSFVVLNPNRRIQIAGICLILYGIARIVAAGWLVSFANTATVMFGALLNRVPDPFVLMNCFHFLYTSFAALSVVCGVLGVIAGWALMSRQQFGRTLGLIAAFLCMTGIPLGLAIGVYTLIVLLQMPATMASNPAMGEPVRDLRQHPSAT
jgi:hypothetical protein